MGKYKTAFILSWQEALQYRLEFITRLVRIALGLVVVIFIWKNVFSQVDSFGPYTLPKMITYLVMAQIIHALNRSKLAREIADKIKSGQFSNTLIRPYNYFFWQFFGALASQFIELLVMSLLFLAFLAFLPQYISLPSAPNLLIFTLLLPLIFTLNYLLNLILAGVAFWVTDIRLFSTFIILAANFLSGEMLPIDLFPAFLERVARFLPFQYRIFFPISVYNGQLNNSQIIYGTGIMLGWILTLALITYKLWQKGIKKYEAVGR